LSRRGILFAMIALVAAPGGASGAPARTATDTYTVSTPSKPWQRADQLDAAGQLTWSARGEGKDEALLRVGYEGVLETDVARAIEAVLGRARTGIRAELEDRDGVERGGFEPDSMRSPGGLRWHGFRVVVRTLGRTAIVARWVALHPDFPARRRAFTLSYDETAHSSSPGLRREADARTLALSLAPAGRGLGGNLAEAWVDARAAAFAARIDSAQGLCWSNRPNASPGREATGYGRGLVLEGDFFLRSPSVPRDSLVDLGPTEYGAAFDRNHDGRVDLWLLNRGPQKFAGRALQPAVLVFADDDFDGRVDGAILEEADQDGDGRVDARILVRDVDGDGRAEEARTFGDAATPGGPGGDRLKIENGGVRVRRIDEGTGFLELVERFRAASSDRANLDRARAACPEP
jgi:hypothetical protein